MEDLQSMRLLELARASRASVAAFSKYKELRLKEFEIMYTVAQDECDEATSWLKDVEWQVGQVKTDTIEHAQVGHKLDVLGGQSSGLFPMYDGGHPEQDSDILASDSNESRRRVNLRTASPSPTPSFDSS